ncbi:hypothetical protein OU798_04445 [Prolixibacteraceae bacterium Z1-6]|uniref:Uncharacterized protein n=1 Tax=Draconibacterium aestuarii TaxID=2998507 RepID=A0A9X3F5Z0_9BACT|nr:hypothetical protein [Prolixibacteraceae bacterium Z1-6]
MNTTKSFYLKLTLLLFGFTFIFSYNSFAGHSLQVDFGSTAEANISTSNFSFDKIWGYIVSLLGPGVAFYAVLIARPLLRNKLIENHVTQRIDQIHNSNSEVRLYCQQLISNYTPSIYKHDKFGDEDLKKIIRDIEKGYLITQDSSSEVATLMYFLKNTLQQYGRRFNYYEQKFHVFSSDIFPFVINVLNRVVMYSTQVIPIPASTDISNVDLIVKPLSRFVTDGKMSKFKNYRLGVNYDKDSASCLIYTDMVNQTSLQHLKECASIVISSTRAIAKLLYLRDIYIPLIWGSKKYPKDALFRIELTLVGFDENTNVSIEGGESNKTVVLYYSNLSNFGYSPKLTEETFVKNFLDDWLKIENFKFPKPIKFAYVTDEMIKVEVDRIELQEIFNTYKRKIRNNLRIKNNSESMLERLWKYICRN